MHSNIDKIEKVVRPHINKSTNLIDVCTEDGELITSVNETQWFFILRPIKVDGVNVHVFTRKNEEEVYSVFSVSESKLSIIAKDNNS